jgi:hypothetical protein
VGSQPASLPGNRLCSLRRNQLCGQLPVGQLASQVLPQQSTRPPRHPLCEVRRTRRQTSPVLRQVSISTT